MRTRAWRFVGVGVVVALAVGLSGGLVERARFGSTENDTYARVEAELRARFDADATLLATVARQASDGQGQDALRAALRDPNDKRLFESVNGALPAEQAGRVGVTIYDAASRPLVLKLKHGDRTDAAVHLSRWLQRAGNELLAEAGKPPVTLDQLGLNLY